MENQQKDSVIVGARIKRPIILQPQEESRQRKIYSYMYV